MDSVETNGITSMEWSILFYLMELNKVVEHICAHFSLGRNMGDCQSYVKQWTKIYGSRPLLAALLSSAHRISARFTVSSCVHSQGLCSLYSASVVLLINYLLLHRELLTLGHSSLFACLFVCSFPRLCYADLWHFRVCDLQRLAGNIECQRPILQTDKYFSFYSGQLMTSTAIQTESI